MPTIKTVLARISAAMLICAGLTPAFAQTAPQPAVETIASYPHGQFLENLNVRSDGSMLITSYVDRTILTWDGNGTPRALVTLDVHPAGVLAEDDLIVITAHGKSFTEGPAFTATNQILVLDRQGRVLRRTALPEARFVNGMVALDADHILIADSIAGSIWLYRPSTGVVSAWLRDPLLGIDPAAKDQRPGANGLKRRGEWLYISNSSRGAIYRVRVAGLAPDGPLATFAQTGPVDDFAFLDDGSIAAATHGPRLIRVDANGGVTNILPQGCDACTSVVALNDGDLIVTTSGNLLEGGDAPARLLRVRRQTSR